MAGKAESVLDKLGHRIVAGRYAPGARLPTEDELARKLRISRPSLREGLKALARKGLVESRTRRGTIALGRSHWDVLDHDVLRWMAAAPPDHEFLIGLVEARQVFEPAAARLAAQRASPAQIIEIERAWQGMADSLPHDIEACNRHDLAFHEAIIAASGNVLLMRLAITIRTALLALFRTSSNARESYEKSLAEHRAVARAIRKRDPDAAERAMRTLLAGTVRDLEPAFRPKRKSI
ncbi:MAG TPA: FadR/GntR family transcriptional regulator [Burkholderiales bacterium]|jgi:DNA-binding FadR family transcriptional regulator